ncbi:MAG: GGDEF domain-containing protein [Candidatus Izimaplasma sp.]|nr:GGDEF domain-containing protein [Candidatus Izimaplasma bacterium]
MSDAYAEFNIKGNGELKSILVNKTEIDLKPKQNIIEVVQANFHHKILEAIKQTKKHELAFIRDVVTVNKTKFTVIFRKTNNHFRIIMIEAVDEMTHILEDIISTQNEQINKTRNLYKQLAKSEEEKDYLDELMVINNEYINLQRELEKKNQQLKGLNQKLRELNSTDYLTEIKNRRGFFDDLKIMNESDDSVLIMMDFNNFKIINDTFGHNKGDEVLKLFVSLMKEKIANKNAQLYRLGGDEFAIIKQKDEGFDIQKAIQFIDNKLNEIHEDLSISFGTANITKDKLKAKEPEYFMHKADKKMYHHKEHKKSVEKQVV